MPCQTTQGFSRNANPSYKNGGLAGHTGIDRSCGYKTPVYAEFGGLVYKIFTPQNPASDGFTGIFTIVEQNDELFEFLYGHCDTITVKEGGRIQRGQQIALESNNGTVYGFGQLCTPEMKKTGCGAHVHYQKRPLTKVWQVTPSMHCLTHPVTGLYRDPNEGCWFNAHLWTDRDGYHGCVDFEPHLWYSKESETKDLTDTIAIIHKEAEKQSDKTIKQAFLQTVQNLLERLIKLVS